MPDGQRDIRLKCQMVINVVNKAKVGKDVGPSLGGGVRGEDARVGWTPFVGYPLRLLLAEETHSPV